MSTTLPSTDSSAGFIDDEPQPRTAPEKKKKPSDKPSRRAQRVDEVLAESEGLVQSALEHPERRYLPTHIVPPETPSSRDQSKSVEGLRSWQRVVEAFGAVEEEPIIDIESDMSQHGLRGSHHSLRDTDLPPASASDTQKIRMPPAN